MIMAFLTAKAFNRWNQSLSSIKNPRCHNLEDLEQRELASYYGITLFSWRDILCPLNGGNRVRKPYIRLGIFNRDHLHINVKGHAQVALTVIRYMQSALQRTGQPSWTDCLGHKSSMDIASVVRFFWLRP